jgi:hypothetical protein
LKWQLDPLALFWGAVLQRRWDWGRAEGLQQLVAAPAAQVDQAAAAAVQVVAVASPSACAASDDRELPATM